MSASASASSPFSSSLSFGTYGFGLSGLVSALDRLWDVECRDSSEFLTACSTLRKIVSNCLQHPNEPKYRSLSLSNAALHHRLLRFPSGVAFLTSIGFGEALFHDERKLILSAVQENTETLTDAIGIIERAEQQIMESRDKSDHKMADEPTFGSVESEEVYEVESIMDERFVFGGWEFLVQWRGYPLSEASWEPIDNILDQQLIRDFRERQRQRAEDDQQQQSAAEPESAPEPTYDLSVLRPALLSLHRSVLSESSDLLAQQEKFHRCIALLDKLAANLLPGDPQCRKLNLENEKLRQFIACYAGAVQFLEFLGFRRCDSSNVLEFVESADWRVRVDRSRAIIKRIAVELPVDQELKELRELGPIDRNVQVFDDEKRAVEPAALQSVESDSGLLLSVAAADRRRLHELTRTDVIVTKQKREEIKAERRRIYHSTIIRCTFPVERCTVQAAFRPQEKLELLFKEIEQWTEADQKQDILLTLPPSTVIDRPTHRDQSFASLGLVPATSFIVKQSAPLRANIIAQRRPITQEDNRVPQAANAAEIESIKKKELDDARQLMSGSKAAKHAINSEDDEIEKRLKQWEKSESNQAKQVPKWAKTIAKK